MKHDNFNLWMMWLKDVGGSFLPYRDDPPTPPKTPRTPRHKLLQRPLAPKKYLRTESGQVVKRAVALTNEELSGETK